MSGLEWRQRRPQESPHSHLPSLFNVNLLSLSNEHRFSHFHISFLLPFIFPGYLPSFFFPWSHQKECIQIFFLLSFLIIFYPIYSRDFYTIIERFSVLSFQFFQKFAKKEIIIHKKRWWRHCKNVYLIECIRYVRRHQRLHPVTRKGLRCSRTVSFILTLDHTVDQSSRYYTGHFFKYHFITSAM